jgi:hypothetical protein
MRATIYCFLIGFLEKVANTKHVQKVVVSMFMMSTMEGNFNDDTRYSNKKYTQIQISLLVKVDSRCTVHDISVQVDDQ